MGAKPAYILEAEERARVRFNVMGVGKIRDSPGNSDLHPYF
jgi:hypothetical protein